MSESARVVPLAKGRRERLRAETREEGHDAGEGLLVALARVLQAGRGGVNWARLAQVWSAFYFAWHSEEVDEFGYDPKFAQTILPFFEFLYTMWWRVETSGVEHVPDRGPALIVANHSGVLPWDGIMINLAVRHEHPARRECRMLALKGVGKAFKQRYRLARFGRGGFVRLALRTGAPIVPCAVVGAEEIHPKIASVDWLGRPLGLPYLPITPTFPLLGPLGVIPLPAKWSIDFADPIPMDTYGPEGAEDPILVNRLSEQVRSIVQGMVDSRLARRRSVWFG